MPAAKDRAYCFLDVNYRNNNTQSHLNIIFPTFNTLQYNFRYPKGFPYTHESRDASHIY